MDYMNWKMNQNNDQWDYEGALVPKPKRSKGLLMKRLKELSKPLTPYQQLRDIIRDGEPITTMIMTDEAMVPQSAMAYNMQQFEMILDLIVELEKKNES